MMGGQGDQQIIRRRRPARTPAQLLRQRNFHHAPVPTFGATGFLDDPTFGDPDWLGGALPFQASEAARGGAEPAARSRQVQLALKQEPGPLDRVLETVSEQPSAERAG